MNNDMQNCSRMLRQVSLYLTTADNIGLARDVEGTTSVANKVVSLISIILYYFDWMFTHCDL